MKKTLPSSRYAIELEGEHLPVIVKKLASSRRIIIRYQPRDHALSLTLPRYVSVRQGLRFVEEKRGWIAQRLKERSARVLFTDGSVIPVLGSEYTLKHTGGRGVVGVDGNYIAVPGDPEFMARRVRDWLTALAKEEITKLAHVRAQAIGKPIQKITVRDTHSHWGSCTQDGRLSLSWRLVLAPYHVFEYVICHEVAHLAHLNHSAKFWDVVAMLCPGHEDARAWLKAHGATLYVYG